MIWNKNKSYHELAKESRAAIWFFSYKQNRRTFPANVYHAAMLLPTWFEFIADMTTTMLLKYLPFIKYTLAHTNSLCSWHSVETQRDRSAYALMSTVMMNTSTRSCPYKINILLTLPWQRDQRRLTMMSTALAVQMYMYNEQVHPYTHKQLCCPAKHELDEEISHRRS